MSKIAEQVLKIVEPIAAEAGIVVVEVEYKKTQHGMLLTVFCDKAGGISLAELEALHRALDEPLDKLDPTDEQPYTLNCSSPGLDRPIKTEWDFIKNKDKQIEVSFYAAQNGKKKIEATLKGWGEEWVELESNGEVISIKLAEIANMKPVIKFN